MDHLHHHNDSFIDFNPARSSTPICQQPDNKVLDIHHHRLPPPSRQQPLINNGKLRKTPSSTDLPLPATLPLSFVTSHTHSISHYQYAHSTIPSRSSTNGNSTPTSATNPFYRKARDLLNRSTSSHTNSHQTHKSISPLDRDHLPDPFNPYGGPHHEVGLLFDQDRDLSQHHSRRDSARREVHFLDEYEFLHHDIINAGNRRRSSGRLNDEPYEYEDFLSHSQSRSRSHITVNHHQSTQTTPFLPPDTPYQLTVDQLDDVDGGDASVRPPSTSPVRSRPRSATIGNLSGSPTLPVSTPASVTTSATAKEEVVPVQRSRPISGRIEAKATPLGLSIAKSNATATPLHTVNLKRNSATDKPNSVRANMRPAPSPPLASPARGSKQATLAPPGSPASPHTANIRASSASSNRQSAPNGQPMQQPTLHKPKSKLRLRLKLTPPYAPGEGNAGSNGTGLTEGQVGQVGQGYPDRRPADLPRAQAPQQARELEQLGLAGQAAGPGKKAHLQGLGLGRPEAGQAPHKHAGVSDGENRPPTQLQPPAGSRQSSSHSHSRTPSNISKPYPVSIGVSGLGISGHIPQQASYGNTYPANGNAGGIRGYHPTQSQGNPNGHAREISLGATYNGHIQQYDPQQQHIAVQRPALTAQTFRGPAPVVDPASHQGRPGHASQYDRRHAVADSHIPKLYEPALGVGIHDAPSPEAIRRAQSGAYGTVNSRTSTITPYNSATIPHRGVGGQADFGRGESGRYLSPHAVSGQTTPTRSTSMASQQGTAPSSQQAGERFSTMSSVNLSLTLSRGNSAISLGLPSSPLTSEVGGNTALAANPGRGRDASPARSLGTRPSRENLSFSGREATPSSFGNVNASFESQPRGLAHRSGTSDENGREVLADDATSASKAAQDQNTTWDFSASKPITAYCSDSEPTVYPHDNEVDSSFLERSAVSSPFSQDKHGASASDKSGTDICSKFLVSEKTDSTAMTEEKASEDISSSDANTTTDSAGTSDTTGTGEGKSGELKPHDGVTDIFTITDQQLSDKYKFVQELGFGNWGSVWQVKPKTADAHPMYRHKVPPGLSPLHPSIGSQHHPQKLAIKLVHRTKTPTTAARVRALWSEMKIVRSLREAPHPSIIGFDSFVITPSYALVIMPCLAELIPVNLKSEKAKGYFRQLASAVAYLHENGITHNDIKPSNIIVSHANVPVLVDFGFAQKWDMNGPPKPSSGTLNVKPPGVGSNKPYKPYWSEICWGTPEYLSPQRAKGEHHDERLSDVWALGITFFEILCGRTPFEISEEEEFSTPEQLAVYFDRTVKGQWVGEWSMKPDMESLLQRMIMPDVRQRITAAQVANSNTLHANNTASISTPPFVRDATAYNAQRTHKAAKKRKSVKAEAMIKPAQQVQHSTQSLERVEAKTPAPQSACDDLVAKGNPTAQADIVEVVSAKVNPAQSQSSQGPETVSKAPNPVIKAEPGQQQGLKQPATRVQQAAVGKVLRRVEDFDNASKDLVRQRSLDHKREAIVSDGTSEALAMRRPASALALRSANEFDQVRHDQQNRHVDRSGAREKSRHARVQSDSNILGASAATTWPAQKVAPAAANTPGVGDKWVHFASPLKDGAGPQQMGAVRGEEGFRSGIPTPAIAAPEALQRLDRIAGWIKDVEKIVATAREALEEAQVETRTSHAISQGEQAEILETIETGTHSGARVEASEPKMRHSRTASAFSTFAEPATPTGWTRPSFDLEDWKPTHLRRQRSDLTGMNVKSSFKPVVSVAVGQGETQLLDGAPGGIDARKLRSHKSAGDLGKLVQTSIDPYDALLTNQPGVARVGDGWSSTAIKTKDKAGFAKKDNGFKGWLTSVKAKFGKKA